MDILFHSIFCYNLPAMYKEKIMKSKNDTMEDFIGSEDMREAIQGIHNY